MPKTPFTTPYAKHPLPFDYDNMNHVTAKFANIGMKAFRKATGLARDEATLDMLVGLMHLCDRDTRFGDFDEKLALAYAVYEESTEDRPLG